MKRVHYLKDGKIRQAPYAQRQDGSFIVAPVTQKGVISATELKSKGCPVLPIQSILKIKESMEKNLMPNGVYNQEDNYGKMGKSRLENAAVSGQRAVLRISITNGEATPESIMVGDGLTLGTRKLGIPAIKAGVVIDGTYGADTLTLLAEITKCYPFRLHGIQFQGFTAAGAKSEKFFTDGFFRQTKADFANRTTQDEELVLADLVTGATYNTHIRETEDFRHIMNGFTGFHVNVPAGESIRINTTIVAVGETKAMDQVNFLR